MAKDSKRKPDREKSEKKRDEGGGFLDVLLEPFRAAEDLVMGVIYDDADDEKPKRKRDEEEDDEPRERKQKAKDDDEDEDEEDDEREERSARGSGTQTVRIEHLFQPSKRKRTESVPAPKKEGEAAEE